jgi:D-alanyl-D-alanine carboxypeptidase
VSDASPGPAARVQHLAEAAITSKATPGIQCLVVDPAAVLVDAAAGWADVAARRPMRSDTTVMMYSMTKTITAAAVLQLVERGAIDLDRPVIAYLPDVPYGDGVLVRHLLAQTSGIPNPIPLKWVHLPEEDASYDEHARLASILARHPRLKFAPGKRYAYSNIAYWLLGQVIERVTGVGFQAHVGQFIFRRLGLSTEEIGFTIPARERHAKGYLPRWSFMNLLKPVLLDRKFIGTYEDRWLHVLDNYLDGAAFGGIVASSRAIAAFLQDQLRERSALFGQDTRQSFLSRQTDDQGRSVPMTLGWHVGTRGGGPYLFKEGGGAGFHGEMRIHPSNRIGCIAVANNGAFDVKRFLEAVEREYAEHLEAPPVDGTRSASRAGTAQS